LIDRVLKKTQSKNFYKVWIQGWGWLEETEIGQSTLEEKLAELLNQDISPKAVNKASKEASRSSKEAGNGGAIEEYKEGVEFVL
jgi:hypothetical protein